MQTILTYTVLIHCNVSLLSFITWMLLLSTISNVASQSIGHYWILISECNFREFMGYSVYFCQRWEWVNLEFRDFYYTVSAIKYNDDANGWYLLSKFLTSSYISTFCVVIVCFTDMISKYTLFQAFYSLLIFFARDNLHSVSALQSTLWAMVKWTYRVLCMSIFTWFTEYSVKHPKIDLQITL